jgi:putative transposase
LEFKTQFFSKTRKAKIARPRFKKRGVNDSFRLPNQKFKVLESKIQIEKIGKIAFVKDRELPESARTLSVTVSKNPSGQYFASVLVEQEIAQLPKTGKSVGVDLGLKTFAVTSDGKEYPASKFFRESQSKLRTAQKHLSRKKKGSIRFKRCKLKVAKIHLKTANQRNHFLHQVTNDLVKNYDTICIEDLNVKGMVKNRKLAKSISDASFAAFRSQLAYKCGWFGKELVVANRFFASSKTCSGCGEVKKELKLSERTYNCEACSLSIDRDLNAAINLKNKSVRVLAD